MQQNKVGFWVSLQTKSRVLGVPTDKKVNEWVECYRGICRHNTEYGYNDKYIGTSIVILAKRWLWLRMMVYVNRNMLEQFL
jgi:hypothetical protein